MKLNSTSKSTLVKFFLAILAGLGIITIYQYVAENEINEDEEYAIYDDEEYGHPLFV